jgi:F-type H+-transporting ATPase subunit gamma
LQDQIVDFVEISDSNVNYFELLPVTEKVMTAYSKDNINSVHIVYSKFINSLTFQPTDLQIFPLDYSLFKTNEENKIPSRVDLDQTKKEILYEPSKQQIIDGASPIYLTTSIFAAISESRVCENGARRNAMETATDNAKDLIDDLTIQFNRARQEHITQEINEIVSGASGSVQ